MRILFLNDGIGDAGGVQNYLKPVMGALVGLGHEVALLHLDALRPGKVTPAPRGARHFCVAADGAEAAVAQALAWRPDVAFSHNFRPLEIERVLLESVPLVKMMHGYFGTCIGGQKAHLAPRPVPCGRTLGAACLALYLPCHCGRRDPDAMLREWRWAREQQALFVRYAAIVTASAHVRREYIRAGASASSVHSIPLFPALEAYAPAAETSAPEEFRIVFIGRMTRLKGGDLLIKAVADASRRAGHSLPVSMVGDGPQRAQWERLARRLKVEAEFTGWMEPIGVAAVLRRASVLAVPSVWPEPFGLVGLEAGQYGVPALAFDVGGIHEWLEEGKNGRLVTANPPTSKAFAAAILRLWGDPGERRRLGCGAREVSSRMSLGHHVDRLEGLLRTVAANPLQEFA